MILVLINQRQRLDNIDNKLQWVWKCNNEIMSRNWWVMSLYKVDRYINEYAIIDWFFQDKTTWNPELFFTFWLDEVKILDEPAKNPKLFLPNISQW
jgi:hypothetical protein